MTLPDHTRAGRERPPEWVEGVTFPDPAVDLTSSWHERDHARLVRRTQASSLRAARNLAHRRAARRVPPPRRPLAETRSFVPAVVADARAAASGDASSARRAGGCPSDDGRRLPHRPDDAGSGRTRTADPQRPRASPRRIVKPGVPLPAASPYPGHFALVRSVVEGLRAIGADFNFNPGRLADLARVVYAPANEALRQAAALKRDGRIDYLVAGPVNALFVDDSDGILQLPEIDRHHRRARMGARVLRRERRRFARRAAPVRAASTPRCGSRRRCDAKRPSCRRVLEERRRGVLRAGRADRAALRLEPRRLRSLHGEHAMFKPADYRRLLDQSAIGVFLSTFETQGLALAEAWSMDVPTVVWDPQGRRSGAAAVFDSRSSAPYLTPETGRLWRTIDELEPALRGALADRSAFRPRAWVLANMTDAICSAALLDIIREGAAEPESADDTMVKRLARDVATVCASASAGWATGRGSMRCSGSVRCACTWAAATTAARLRQHRLPPDGRRGRGDGSEPAAAGGRIGVAGLQQRVLRASLPARARAPHLRRVRQALAADGVCCYIGIPYFPAIARLYVERGPGTASDVFDLYNVYRYTHGDPEGQAAWWLGQLHKSLFDEDGGRGAAGAERLRRLRDVLLRLSGRRQRGPGDHGVLRHVRAGGAGRASAAVRRISRAVRRHPDPARDARMASGRRRQDGVACMGFETNGGRSAAEDARRGRRTRAHADAGPPAPASRSRDLPARVDAAAANRGDRRAGLRRQPAQRTGCDIGRRTRRVEL